MPGEGFEAVEVSGIRAPLHDTCENHGVTYPAFAHIALLNFKGRLVYDGLLRFDEQEADAADPLVEEANAALAREEKGEKDGEEGAEPEEEAGAKQSEEEEEAGAVPEEAGAKQSEAGETKGTSGGGKEGATK
eukprot:8890381-Pyramimonas_sp.AAC.1